MKISQIVVTRSVCCWCQLTWVGSSSTSSGTVTLQIIMAALGTSTVQYCTVQYSTVQHSTARIAASPHLADTMWPELFLVTPPSSEP